MVIRLLFLLMLAARPEADEPREKPICIRFTEREREEINTKVGSRNKSEIMRRLILRWAREEGE
jgi:hypothetical protein